VCGATSGKWRLNTTASSEMHQRHALLRKVGPGGHQRIDQGGFRQRRVEAVAAQAMALVDDFDARHHGIGAARRRRHSGAAGALAAVASWLRFRFQKR
jgi:hypothetical protein